VTYINKGKLWVQHPSLGPGSATEFTWKVIAKYGICCFGLSCSTVGRALNYRSPLPWSELIATCCGEPIYPSGSPTQSRYVQGSCIRCKGSAHSPSSSQSANWRTKYIYLQCCICPSGSGLEFLHLSPASRKRRRKRNPVPGGIIGGQPVLGRYKYWDLALQVGGVSNETVEYGYGFCPTRTREWLLWLFCFKLNSFPGPV
jgi:hypothetical protein